jgi:hypothetical protein
MNFSHVLRCYGAAPCVMQGSEPAWLSTLLTPFAAPARSSHETLFGVVGANGPRFLMSSQKLVLFNAIVSLAAGFTLASGDATAAWNADPFLAGFLLPAFLAIAIAPLTFLMYSWV